MSNASAPFFRGFIAAPAMEAYSAAFRKASVGDAMIEDYRAAVDEDLAQDAADIAVGRKLQYPVLALWPAADHLAGRPTPADTWLR